MTTQDCSNSIVSPCGFSPVLVWYRLLLLPVGYGCLEDIFVLDDPPYLGKIALVSIGFKMVLTQITMLYPPNINR